MKIDYKFRPGQRVASAYDITKTGDVTTCVPRDGSIPLYFVKWEDGTEGFYMAEELTEY